MHIMICCVAEKHTKKQLTPFVEFELKNTSQHTPSDSMILSLENEFHIEVNGSTNYVDYVIIEA
jgi:hypothetical protein